MTETSLSDELLAPYIAEIWRSSVIRLEKDFEIIIESFPQNFSVETGNEHIENMIGSFDGTTIYLAEEIIEEPYFLESAIAMICFKHAFREKESICIECIEDFASAAIRVKSTGA